MAINLGGTIMDTANMLGINVPEVDPDHQVTAANLVVSHGSTVTTHQQSANTTAQAISDQNSGTDVTAFSSKWGTPGQPSPNLSHVNTAAYLAAAGHIGAAAIVTGVLVITASQILTYLASLFTAESLAPVTGGASEAAVPELTAATRSVLNTVYAGARRTLAAA